MLNGAIVPREELSVADIERMHTLMVGHYDGLERSKFLEDLAEKDGALLVRELDGTIQGFSTYRVHHEVGPRGRHRMLFSGDTIVDARSWGQMVTLRTLGRLFAGLLAVSGDPLYWILLSKGIRTYLLLPLFFRQFCPGGGLAESSEELALMRSFAARRYGAEFDFDSNIVRPAVSADRLKPEWARVSQARLADPHVRYFLARNPGHVVGEELVSIAPIRLENLTGAGRRLVCERE